MSRQNTTGEAVEMQRCVSSGHSGWAGNAMVEGCGSIARRIKVKKSGAWQCFEGSLVLPHLWALRFPFGFECRIFAPVVGQARFEIKSNTVHCSPLEIGLVCLSFVRS
jgi:hypothetical protein